ncbi:glycosyltransferase family 39 protein [Myxococcus sp. RHSTA-1-4]|uniref:ArnT family glycosyltransferase n=1 Tax=Myxococcus sp. RHSTA-1-4 TaxID=2874601 RepID=UPI001CBB887E|nr:glycosyltransferase family 39 protein [Myxococcus sp. RHSTA-1-4]MBZ4421006.1 glycosyltransferase family 39 protein [Myxococcus sp. RHSTA-1-4]
MKACLALLGAAVVGRLALSLGTDVYFDTAYYWQWARHLDWGYYDHPPMVAWLIAALGPRGTSLLCGAGTVAAVWGLARDVYGSREAAWRAAALWSAVPASMVAGVWATPDSPLLLFWTLALWALWRERWVWAGLACGLALLSKYPAVLLGLIFLLAAARARRLPRGAWLTAVLAALCFVPVVLWNARHEWVGFLFQLRHGLGGQGGWQSLGEYVLGQLALGGPVLLVLAGVYAVRGPPEQFLLRMAAVVPLLFFGYAAARTRGEANWPAAAYVAASVGVAGMRPVWRRAVAASELALVLAVGSHSFFPVLRFERDTVLWRTHGWSVLRELATPERLFPGMDARNLAAIYAPDYQLASQVAYHTGRVTHTAPPARFSQYDLWPPPSLRPGQEVLWVMEEGGPGPPDELSFRFTQMSDAVELVSGYRGRRLHRFWVWRLWGLQD